VSDPILTQVEQLPVQTLPTGTRLLVEGEATGKLYILIEGKLAILREGVAVATIERPGAVIGEISVLLGHAHSATVTALAPSRLHVIEDGLGYLQSHPGLALEIARLTSARLASTTALLVELTHQTSGRKIEQGLLQRIFALLGEARPAQQPVRPQTPSHE